MESVERMATITAHHQTSEYHLQYKINKYSKMTMKADNSRYQKAPGGSKVYKQTTGCVKEAITMEWIHQFLEQIEQVQANSSVQHCSAVIVQVTTVTIAGSI